jgi:NAD(P)H-flavin reductase
LESISKEECDKGFTLFCQAKPLSNIEISPISIIKVDKAAPITIDAKVYRVTRKPPDVTLLELRFPAGKRVQFKAGQYLDIILENGLRRSYSMANQPKKNDGVNLHIRHVAGGEFTKILEGGIAAGATIKLELPLGSFYLRDVSLNAPLILIASGTGFAPLKSIMEDLLRQGEISRQIHFYWGGRKKSDLYMSELPEQWAAQHKNFKYIPVLSEEDNGQDRTGFVHKAVMEDFPSLKDHHVYACGVPIMVNSAKEDLVKYCELDSSKFFADIFVVSGENQSKH